MRLKEDKKIHELTVYNNQIKCAEKIMNQFKENNTPILLIAQMQQGKTGTCACVINEFIKECNINNEPFEIIYLINISDNEIKHQTQIRLARAGVCPPATVIHHSNMKNYSPKKECKRLLIVDECHSSIGKDRPFNSFMDKLGVNYGTDISNWINKNTYVLSVSATAYAHLLRSWIDEYSFKPIVLEMDKEYYSLQDMNKDNRFKRSEKLIINKIPSIFLKERLKEFEVNCCISAPGYLIIRSRGPSIKYIKDYIENKYDSISVSIYNSEMNNIHLIDEYLQIKPKTPTVILISGSMRAGKTLSTTENIRMWIDSPSSSSDTMCQSVGRCLGYPSNGHSKFNDTFPVYCNLDEINDSIEFFNEFKCAPKGNYNFRHTEQGEKISGRYKILPHTSELDVRKAYPNQVTISKCSTNKKNSIAKDVTNDANRGNIKNGKFRVFHIDGSNGIHDKDFNELAEKKPNMIGKYVIFVKEEDNKHSLISSKIKSKAMFSNSS